jgi:hypothetical protein
MLSNKSSEVNNKLMTSQTLNYAALTDWGEDHIYLSAHL